MYAEHFGLEKAVFDGGIAQHDDLFLGPRQQRVAANLKIGLSTRDSIVTLIGPLGVGKTTIAAQALSITATRRAQAWVGNTPLAPDELLELLLAGFELAPYDMGRVQRLQTWRQFMGEMSATDTRVCILVENALALGVEGLQALEALTAADPNDCPGANLVLMGPPELAELLEAPGLASLKQRIRSRQRLEPMSLEEVEQYLQHRIAVAGGDHDAIVAPGTAAIVHSFSGGIPRVIDNVCETALIVAATRRATQLIPEIVQQVAKGVYRLTPSGEAPKAPVAAAPAAQATAAASEEQPTEAAVLPVKPAPVDAPAAAPRAAPAAAGEQPAEAAVPPAEPAAVPTADPAPVDAPAPAPEATPAGAGKQPTVKAVPAAKSAPVDAPAQAPRAVPVAAEEQSTEESLASAEPAPADAAAPVDPKKAATPEVPANAGAADAVAHAAGPGSPMASPAVDADAAPQPARALLDSSGTAEDAFAPPVLTDEADTELLDDSQDAAENTQPPAATLPADAPALPEKELQPDARFSEDFAAATHLHEISDEMAELLFSADPAATAASSAESSAPLDSADLDFTPGGTAVVGTLDDDAGPESEENRPDPKTAPTVVF